MTIDPGVMGGIKLGYFLDIFPYFAVEAEGSIGNHPQPSQTVALHPPLAGATFPVPVHQENSFAVG